ncbi:carbohydrate ABC transporter permease [Mycetocola zhujimingii]|uniref:carbohydrate ABC transporter permease n=1 Tax=Mycetocola zhujimingii TaxID=2079792 RepID=UPI000D367FD7|nr:carbohydrate ABC transporter permease [Mycetocola zhujimingii]AWB85376.1 ABC transporter permease [Mycetocola zhujimingii]
MSISTTKTRPIFVASRSAAPRRSPIHVRKSVVLSVFALVLLIYSLLPLFWLVVSATKSQPDLLNSFGLWFGSDFNLFENIRRTLTYDDGVFVLWLRNTLLYVVVGAGGATLLGLLGGWGLAKFAFFGRRAVFAVILGAIAIPGTALAVPTFLMFAEVGLTNTPWAVIIPALIEPFGLYLMWIYASESVPDELVEAARIDGAGEFRILFQIALPVLAPGLVTVLLFNVVSGWNNFFLPLIMLNDPQWYPLTLGLESWSGQANIQGAAPIFDLVITGSLLAILPLVAAFLLLQRYWQSGLTLGGVKE